MFKDITIMPSLSTILTTVLAFVSQSNAQLPTLAASNFDSGDSLDPFYECTYKRPSYAKVVNQEVETWFGEAGYDGTRADRGIELCADTKPVQRELWHGFSLSLPADYPTNKQSIVAQQFCFGGCSSWCGTLDVVGTSLQVDHRYACVTSGSALTTKTIVDSISLGDWHDVVINARFSNAQDGHYTVYWDGKIIYNAQNINLGFDSAWTSDGKMTNGVGFKNGQYNAGMCSGLFRPPTPLCPSFSMEVTTFGEQ
jgi:hypothetical protein